MFRINVTSNPTGNDQFILDVGTGNGDGEGGWGITLSSTGGLKFVEREQSGGSASTATSISSVSGIQTIGFYVDATGTPTIYRFRDTDGPSGSALTLPLASLSESKGVTFGSRRPNEASFDRELNSAGGPVYVSDMRIIRFVTDGYQTFADAFNEFHTTNREENLQALANK
jgi:hypothetical protein